MSSIQRHPGFGEGGICRIERPPHVAVCQNASVTSRMTEKLSERPRHVRGGGHQLRHRIVWDARGDCGGVRASLRSC